MELKEQPLFATAGYEVRFLDQGDQEVLQGLVERCADYHQILAGLPPGPDDAEDILVDLPPGKNQEDKFVIGVFQPLGRLVGVLDVIRNYPRPVAWWIGLLMLDPEVRGQGLGRRLVDAFDGWVKEQGAQAIFLGVVERNVRAFHFWQSLGFRTIETRSPQGFGVVEQAVYVMRRDT